MIIKNFIWAMFNSNNPIDLGLLGMEVAYKMPDAGKDNLKPLSFPCGKLIMILLLIMRRMSVYGR